MTAPRTAFRKHLRWWPITATAVFAFALVAGAWWVPEGYARWQLVGLQSDDRDRQLRALAWAVSDESHFARARPRLGLALVEAETYEARSRLVALMQQAQMWHRNQVPKPAWLTWLEELVASEAPDVRRLALRLILDATDARNSADPWHPLTTTDRHRIALIVEALLEDADPEIAAAAALVSRAWSDMPPRVSVRRVIDAELPPPDLTDDADAEVIETLWRAETGRLRSAAHTKGCAPLVRLAFVRNRAANPDLEQIEDLLGHENPWIQALAASAAGRRIEGEALRDIALDWATRVDPIERRAGYILAALEFDRPRTAGQMPVAIELPPRFPRSDPVERLLYDAVTNAGFGDMHQASQFDAALKREGVPYPTLLIGLLATQSRAGWDHVLGPFGLSDDELITLLDHYRFAWVLDALMPDGAPRFPLWVDRKTQRDAIAELRVWYARNRATWTHG